MSNERTNEADELFCETAVESVTRSMSVFGAALTALVKLMAVNLLDKLAF